jgi:hypothetical protein
MTVAELVQLIGRVAQIHARLGAMDNSNALRELATILSTSDSQDVSKLVKVIRPRQRIRTSSPRRRPR